MIIVNFFFFPRTYKSEDHLKKKKAQN